jgi:hypothetical protein
MEKSMSKGFATGDKVAWNWGSGTGTGKVVREYTRKISKTIGGSEITRNASEDNPAYLIEQDDGDQVLKSESELKGA